jgi:hypothetical protein
MGRLAEKGGRMRVGLLAAWVLAVLLLAPSSRTSAQETTQEILVGYNSEQDRRDGEKQLAGAKDKLKIRGQSLESLQLQAISDKALKLRIGLPQAVKADIARTPSLQAAILKELADQLKRADSRIVYAHPNWVLGGMPPVARGLPVPAGKESSSAPAEKQTASVAAPKEGKRAAKRGKTGKRYAARKRRGKVVAQRACRSRHQAVWTMPRGGRRAFRLSAWGFGR